VAAAGYPAVVDRGGVSPEPSSDIEELNRRRAAAALGWATVGAQNRRRGRVYGLAGAVWVAGLLLAVTTAMFLPVYLSEHGVLAEGTLGWLTTVSSLGTMAVGCGLYGWWYGAARPHHRHRAQRASHQVAQLQHGMRDGIRVITAGE
jgi:hypothetical protein